MLAAPWHACFYAFFKPFYVLYGRFSPTCTRLYDFNAEMVFMRDVIRYFTIGPTATRVAAITYSDEP